MSARCGYCGTELDDRNYDAVTGEYHHVVVCREYVRGAMLSYKAALDEARAAMAVYDGYPRDGVDRGIALATLRRVLE